MGTADHGGASSWTARYVTVLSQARWLVLASWALLSVLAAWQGPLFLSECVMRMPPETWTRSARGRAVVSAAFPEREGKEILALLLASNDGSAVTTPAVAEFTRRLSAVALDFAPRWVVFDLEHYYSYNEELPSIAEAFVSHGAAHNRTHMLMLFTLMTHKTHGRRRRSDVAPRHEPVVLRPRRLRRRRHRLRALDARPGGDGGAQQLELVAFGAAGRVQTRGAARF